MGDNAGEISVQITANIAGLTAGLNAATAGVKESTDAMASSFTGVEGSTTEAFASMTNASERAAESMEGDFSRTEARHAAHMLGMNRAVGGFVATLPGVGAAMSMAFAPLAIMELIEWVGKGVEKLVEFGKSSEKLADDELAFKNAGLDAFNSVDEKILEAQKKTDELSGDHLGALQKQLKLIDMATMKDLVASFEVADKAALDFFKDTGGRWYSFDAGSKGATHALKEFGDQYEHLLKVGGKDNEKAAADLLTGTLASAQKVRDAQNAINAAIAKGNLQIEGNGTLMAAQATLREAGIGNSQKDVAIQQKAVDILSEQVAMQGRYNTLRSALTTNATTEEHNKAAKDEEKGERGAAAEAKKDAEEQNAIYRSLVQQGIEDYRLAAQEKKQINQEVSEYGLNLLNQDLNAEMRTIKQEEGANRIAAAEYKKEAAEKKAADDAAEREVNKRIALEKRAANSIASGYAQMTLGMIRGTQSFTQTATSLMDRMAENLIRSLMRTMMTHVMVEQIKTTSTAAGTATRDGMERTSNLKSLMGSANSAAAKSWDWASAWGGPIAGAIAAAATWAGVMAFDSFDNGGLVQQTGLVFAHQGEGVLTAPTTQMLQNMNKLINSGAVGGGGGLGSGGSSGGDTFNAHFHGVVDAKSFFQQHQGHIIATIKDAAKNRRS